MVTLLITKTQERGLRAVLHERVMDQSLVIKQKGKSKAEATFHMADPVGLVEDSLPQAGQYRQCLQLLLRKLHTTINR
jgi:hypothetical protein